jgi:hypothetical protein
VSGTSTSALQTFALGLPSAELAFGAWLRVDWAA